MMRALKNAFRRMRLARKGVRVEGDYPKRWMNGYMICPLGLDRNSVIYSVGVGRHISFDLALIESFGATVHAFDPTPGSIEWVRGQKLPEQFVFHDYGVAAYDGPFRFYPPRRAASAHFTSVPKTKRTDDTLCIEAPVFTLGAIMKKLGHDHLDLLLSDGGLLRFHDPRRFGIFLWIPQSPASALAEHPLLRDLGPEPLGADFDGTHLHRLSRSRRVAVKSFIMDASVVVGVGNIYASESLFLAGIHPARACNRIGPERYRRLAETIRQVLGDAIAQGGTTLRDFVNESGSPGYFAQSLRVYGREGEPCRACGEPIRQRRIGQRSSFYCTRCQT